MIKFSVQMCIIPSWNKKKCEKVLTAKELIITLFMSKEKNNTFKKEGNYEQDN